MKVRRETGLKEDKDNTLKTYDSDTPIGEKEKPSLGMGLPMLVGLDFV